MKSFIEQVRFPMPNVSRLATGSTVALWRTGALCSVALWGLNLLTGMAVRPAYGMQTLESTSQNSMERRSIESVEDLKSEFAALKELWDSKQFVQAADIVNRCTEAFPNLVKSATPKDAAELLKVHKRLDAVHELLSIEGALLDPFPSWKDLVALKKELGKREGGTSSRTKPVATRVSFTQDIAPWLVEQCSSCHIQRNEGNFSLASFASLARGVDGNIVVFAGDPIGSRLVEVIESGDMPRGGQKVAAEKLNQLKEWIKQGASFDGPSPTVPLRELAAAGSAMKSAAAELEMAKANRSTNRNRTANANRNANAKANNDGSDSPSGTVSFAKDIAPLLLENCKGCHLDGTQNRGGLGMNTFAELLRGGDSGTVVNAGAGEESLLIKKLRGTAGQRMPAGGRPPLSDSNIAMIAKWISEGAKLDGGSPDRRLNQIASESWVANASDSELKNKRIEAARAKWQVVSPGSKPEEAVSENFHVLGSVGPEATKRILESAEAAERQIKKLFGIRSKDSLIKGGVTIFAFKQRYDYSEFGTMAEQRSLPVEWSGHWRNNLLDAYVTLVDDSANAKINESALVQQITSLWLSSFEGTPRWFSDGAGRMALASTVNANDARIQGWTKRLPESLKLVTNLKVFMDGAINDEDYATIGYWLVRTMSDNAGKKQYDSLIRTLVGGTPFDQAMLKHIMPVNNFLQQTLGTSR